MKRSLARLGGQWHLDDLARRAMVTARLSGERAKFAVRGRPHPGAAIVLASIGRSGSTWLADLLCAAPGIQQIFEPLHPETSAELRRLLHWQEKVGETYRRVYLRPSVEHPEWRAFLAKVLTGRVRNYRTDYARTSYFPDRYLVKFIRANLMLGYLYDCFQPQTILLTRHPCAVVYSRLRKVRSPWYADVSDLLRQAALVEDYLRPWLADIEKETDLLGAHAVWWAVENRVALQEMATRPHYLVFYETLYLHPRPTLDPLFAWLGLPSFDLPAQLVARSSRVARHRQHGAIEDEAAILAQLSDWQQGLTAEEQRRIVIWADRLEIPWYTMAALPAADGGLAAAGSGVGVA